MTRIPYGMKAIIRCCDTLYKDNEEINQIV